MRKWKAMMFGALCRKRDRDTNKSHLRFNKSDKKGVDKPSRIGYNSGHKQTKRKVPAKPKGRIDYDLEAG